MYIEIITLLLLLAITIMMGIMMPRFLYLVRTVENIQYFSMRKMEALNLMVEDLFPHMKNEEQESIDSEPDSEPEPDELIGGEEVEEDESPLPEEESKKQRTTLKDHATTNRILTPGREVTTTRHSQMPLNAVVRTKVSGEKAFARILSLKEAKEGTKGTLVYVYYAKVINIEQYNSVVTVPGEGYHKLESTPLDHTRPQVERG